VCVRAYERETESRRLVQTIALASGQVYKTNSQRSIGDAITT